MAAETAPTARLNAAEGHLWLVVHGRVVDVAHAALYAPGYRQRAPDVAPEDSRGESVLTVVGNAHGLVDAIHLADRHERREGLGCVDLHIRRHPCNHRRREARS